MRSSGKLILKASAGGLHPEIPAVLLITGLAAATLHLGTQNGKWERDFPMETRILIAV